MSEVIDLRSDTVTKPTEAMRQAMARAEVGDDVYKEDPTVRELEEYAAHLLGKESGLFVTSGTQGNQVAIATHVRQGEEVIAEAESHIFLYEGAAVSAIAGAQTRQVAGHRGSMDGKAVAAAIRDSRDIHQPRTGLICVENTHNRAGGAVLPFAELAVLQEVAKTHGIPIHMDGARMFNAVAASGKSAKEIASVADTVQFCLSKGLGAPVGSLLVGSRSFIEQARKWRKRMGGGLRQVGVLAAPGLIALKNMVERLPHDHENARLLATGLAEIPGLDIDVEQVETNIVIVNLNEANLPRGFGVDALVSGLRQEGVLASGFGAGRVRFVTHYDVTTAEITKALAIVRRVIVEAR